MSGHTLTLDDYREFPASQKFVPDEHQTFTYDELDRLKTVSKTFADGYTAVYTYTAIGNLIGKTEDTKTQTFNFGAQQGGCSGGALSKAHAPKEMVANGSTNPLCHDANGNMTQRVEMSGTQALTYLQQWDKENRLTVVTNTATSPALITKFYYNGDGARVKKTEQNNGGAVITTTFYAGALEIISTTQTVTRTHYMAGAQLIAVREVTNTTSAGTLTFLHSDHLGSTSTTTCGNTGGCGSVALGGVISRQSYYPYGSVRSMTGTLPTSHTYTGQVSDGAGTGGLMYYNARFYSPGLARFASADTIIPNAGNPQAFNRYSYTRGNPINRVDPSGHCDGMPGGQSCLDAYTSPVIPGQSSLTTTPTSTPTPITTPVPVAAPEPLVQAYQAYIAPPDFSNGYPPPHPQIDGLPDEDWEWGDNWGKGTEDARGPGYRNRRDPTETVYRPDPGRTSRNGNEGEDPHWDEALPKGKTGQKWPPNPEWGRGGQRSGPGVYDPETGTYKPATPSSEWLDEAGFGAIGGATAYMIYRVIRLVTSPACGPAMPVCAVSP